MWKPLPMRRKERALPEEDTRALLQRGEWLVLATADAEGIPLATPLSYVMVGGAAYFHCARTGQKLDNLAAQPWVSFTVVDGVRAVYAPGNFSTLFESIIAHGTARIVTDDAEKHKALYALCEKYLPENMASAEADIAKSLAVTCVVRIDIDEVTGKGKHAP